MGKQIKTKGVAFNLADDYQRHMFEFCDQKTNFSNYIKRLIQRDMEHGNAVETQQKAPTVIGEQLGDMDIDFNSFR